VRLKNCERLNRDLETLFLQRETEEYRNPSPSHVPQLETFESRFNLFRWTESCVQELRSFMLNAVAQMVIETISLKPQDITGSVFKITPGFIFHATRVPSFCTITRWLRGRILRACRRNRCAASR
jgi:hypothetical protein